jgi:hypothetical protein
MAAVLSCSTSALAGPTESLSFDFSNNVGQNLTFSPASGGGPAEFTFQDEDNAYDDFQVTQETQDGTPIGSGGPNNLLGLFGDLDGTYEFSDPAGSTSVAVSSSNGSFEIQDSNNTVFASGIEFFELRENVNSNSVLGELALSGATYSGTNDALQFLSDSENTDVPITFQLSAGAADLDQLYNDGLSTGTSYSGSVSVVPVPQSVMLLGFGLLSLGALVRRWLPAG